MNDKDRIWILMARALSGEATRQEHEELQVLLLREPELFRQYRMLKKLWSSGNTEDVQDENVYEKHRLRHILNRAEEERSAEGERPADEDKNREHKSIFRRLFFNRSAPFVYAAVIALILIVYHYPLTQKTNGVQGRQQEIVSVQNGSRTKLLLPDGTSVWLNGDSKLYYDHSFSGKTREVRLEGEAFFDVVKDAKRPFIVRAGKISIRVLGTAFNVKFYKEDKNIETTLLRGKIEVSGNTKDAGSHIILTPNQKLIIPAKLQAVQPEIKEEIKIINLDSRLKENEHIETSWVYNRVEFRGESFEELARKLERWYDITIHFDDDRVKQLRFNGSFEKETIEEAFGALQKVASFKYKIYEREVFIKSSE